MEEEVEEEVEEEMTVEEETRLRLWDNLHIWLEGDYEVSRSVMIKRIKEDMEFLFERDPYDKEATLAKGTIERMDRKLDEAIDTFNSFLNYHGRCGKGKMIFAYRERSSSHFSRGKKGDYENAAKGFQNVLVMDNECDHSMVGLGNSMIRLGKIDKANEVFSLLTEIYPMDCRGYYGLGVCSSYKGEYRKSNEYFFYSIMVKAEYASAYYYVAQNYNFLKENISALTYINLAFQNYQPKEYEATIEKYYVMRGRILRELGEHEKALEDYNKALSLGYKSNEVYELRGICYLFLCRYKDALRDFEYLEKNKDQEKGIQFYYGLCYEGLEQRKKANGCYYEEMINEECDPHLIYRLAMNEFFFHHEMSSVHFISRIVDIELCRNRHIYDDPLWKSVDRTRILEELQELEELAKEENEKKRNEKTVKEKWTFSARLGLMGHFLLLHREFDLSEKCFELGEVFDKECHVYLFFRAAFGFFRRVHVKSLEERIDRYIKKKKQIESLFKHTRFDGVTEEKETKEEENEGEEEEAKEETKTKRRKKRSIVLKKLPSPAALMKNRNRNRRMSMEETSPRKKVEEEEETTKSKTPEKIPEVEEDGDDEEEEEEGEGEVVFEEGTIETKKEMKDRFLDSMYYLDVAISFLGKLTEVEQGDLMPLYKGFRTYIHYSSIVPYRTDEYGLQIYPSEEILRMIGKQEIVDQDHYNYFYYQALVHMQAGKHDKVIEFAEKAEKIFSDGAIDPHLLIAEIRTLRKEYKQALEILLNLLKSFEVIDENYNNKGFNNNSRRVIEVERVYYKYPNLYKIYYFVGRLIMYIDKREFEKARAYFTKSMELYTDYYNGREIYNLYLERGKCYVVQEEFLDREKRKRSRQKDDKENDIKWLMEEESMMALRLAEKDFTKAIDLCTGNSNYRTDLLLERGSVLEKMGRIDDALRDINEAIRFSPNHPESHYLRMRLKNKKGNVGLKELLRDVFFAVREGEKIGDPNLETYRKDLRRMRREFHRRKKEEEKRKKLEQAEKEEEEKED